MAEILALMPQHDEQAVLCAVELALDEAVSTRTHILNILHWLVDAKAMTVTSIDAPSALTQRREPAMSSIMTLFAGRSSAMRHDPASAA